MLCERCTRIHIAQHLLFASSSYLYFVHTRSFLWPLYNINKIETRLCISVARSTSVSSLPRCRLLLTYNNAHHFHIFTSECNLFRSVCAFSLWFFAFASLFLFYSRFLSLFFWLFSVSHAKRFFSHSCFHFLFLVKWWKREHHNNISARHLAFY